MPPDLPPGRYDPPSRRNRILAGVVGGALGGAALLAGYAAYARHQEGRLDAELTAYDVRSDTLVRITFQVVTRGHDGECEVRARDRTGIETGSQLVQVKPSGQRSQQLVVDLRTRTRAANGELVGCRRL
ncbi:MAG: hypothetical protein QOJ79_3583 [Actinomycetota bacterium]|nr:hypothetical protein [Actinomycetota bacterium]